MPATAWFLALAGPSFPTRSERLWFAAENQG